MTLRRAGAILGLALLTACTPEPQTYRDTGVPLGATTRFEADRFAGDWQVVAGFGPTMPGTVQIVPDDGGNILQITSSGRATPGGAYRQGVPGELIPVSGRGETLVVMWVDEGFRTAAIGTPSGRFGVILNRDTDLPADRGAAAREILDFYGWDISRLQRTGQ